MQTRTFTTALGPVPLWGRFEGFDDRKLLVLVIRGVMPVRDYMLSIADRLPDVDVALAHLPGMHSPMLSDSSVVAFSAAFDEVLATLGRPAVVLGISLGGTVCLGLRSPLIRALIALDPPLRSESFAPLTRDLRELAALSAPLARWVEGVCGVRDGDNLGIDFSGLLDGLPSPTQVLAGDKLPGPRGADGTLPSLIGPFDRAALAAHPRVNLRVLEGVGHNIPREAVGAMMTTLRHAIEAASSPP